MRRLLITVAPGAAVLVAGTGWALLDRLIPRLRRH
jgi:hypothetical protein